MKRSIAGPVVLAFVLAPILAVVPPTAFPVAAAEELRLEGTAVYVADPDIGAVHVSVAVTATNLKPNTTSGGVTTQYYYRDIVLAVQPEATNVLVTDGRGSLRVTRTPDDGYDLALIRLRSNLFYRRSASFTLSFDLPGGAPRSDSYTRVGQAFVSLYAFAWGDPGRASVRIELPTGFDVEMLGEPLVKSSEGGRTILAAQSIPAPDDWWAFVTAERNTGLTADRIRLPKGDAIVVRAWPEDDEWRTRVLETLRRGMPMLQDRVGLDWPVEGDLVVTEVYSASLEGYAGLYDTETDTIRISEHLDELTILHEAAHAWFNDDLFAGRWISEGLADELASAVLTELDLEFEAPKTPNRSHEARTALNVWRFPGSIDDEETDEREQYGYNASWYVVRTIVRDIGDEAFVEVLRAAANDEIAYVGAGEPETVGAVDDWRRFLDLVDERGGSSVANPLFVAHVLTPQQEALLAERAEAREDYASLKMAAGAWAPPPVVRLAMSAWHFDDADGAIAEAVAILAVRDAVEGESTALGLEPPDLIITAWDAAIDDLDAAAAAGASLQAALDDLEAAKASLEADRDMIVKLGLLGETPEASWDTAVVAFEEGQLDAADGATDELVAVLAAAPETGRMRLAGIGAGGAAGIALLAFLVRRRRRRRVTATTTVVAGPYGTLPAEPSSEVGEPTVAAPDDPAVTEGGDRPTET